MREYGETDSAYIRRNFDGAVDLDALDEVDELLRAEGLNPDNIRPYKSKRRKELLKQQKTSTVVTRSIGQLPAEQIVDNLPWPTSVNGEVNPAFVAGMRYEAMNVIRGIRMAQELNKMGLEQAKPVIEMAKEMRAAEGQAAQTIAGQLGQVTMQSNQQILQAIQSLAASQPRGESVNPAMQAFFTAAQPFLGQIFQRMFSSFSGMGQPQGSVQQAPGIEIPAQTVQPATPAGPPPGMRPGEENEFQEA